MYGYKISFEGLPTIRWACETQMNDYSWYAEKNDANTLELGIIKAEKHTIVVNNKKHVVKNVPVLTCIVGDETTADYADSGIKVEVTSVAMNFPRLNIVSGEITEADCEDWSILILPRFVTDCPEDFLTETNLLLHKFVKHYTKESLADQVNCIAIFFQTLYKIDSYIRKRFLTPNQKSYYYYVKKINHIIETQYNKRLTQESVAKELGISSSYLSTLYKKATGQTFSEYLIQTRMKHATQLLLSTDLSTSQLASAVGFDDESHFRKRFKAYFGMNVREYRYIQKGLTLYHQKPIRKQEDYL